MTGAKVKFSIDALELARGHDGPLRGAPDPVLMMGVYSVARGPLTGPSAPSVPTGTVRLLDRRWLRVPVQNSFPCRVAVDDAAAPLVAVPSGHAVGLLLVALEEDGGKDLQRIYGLLERPDGWVTWWSDAREPDPHGLAETFMHLASTSAEAHGQSVRVLLDGLDPATTCKDDDYIGSYVAAMNAVARGRWTARAHVVSRDGKNDWTALLSVESR
jgi:hypothetical protein